MDTTRKNDPGIPDRLRQQLAAAHQGLLHVHKALIDYERARYERSHGRIPGPGAFLQVLLNDPAFAWLRPMSGLAAQIDEYISSKDPVDPLEGDALLKAARELLVPSEDGSEFQREYHRSLQESPDVVRAHGDWKLRVMQDKRNE